VRSAGVSNYVSRTRPLSRTGGRIYDRNTPPTRARPARVAEPFATLLTVPVSALCEVPHLPTRGDTMIEDRAAESSAATSRGPVRDHPATSPYATPNLAEQPAGDRRPPRALLVAGLSSRPDCSQQQRRARWDNRSNSARAEPRSDRWRGVHADIAQPVPAGTELRNAYRAVRKSGWSVNVRPHPRQRHRASQITVPITRLATM